MRDRSQLSDSEKLSEALALIRAVDRDEYAHEENVAYLLDQGYNVISDVADRINELENR